MLCLELLWTQGGEDIRERIKGKEQKKREKLHFYRTVQWKGHNLVRDVITFSLTTVLQCNFGHCSGQFSSTTCPVVYLVSNGIGQHLGKGITDYKIISTRSLWVLLKKIQDRDSSDSLVTSALWKNLLWRCSYGSCCCVMPQLCYKLKGGTPQTQLDATM